MQTNILLNFSWKMAQNCLLRVIAINQWTNGNEENYFHNCVHSTIVLSILLLCFAYNVMVWILNRRNHNAPCCSLI